MKANEKRFLSFLVVLVVYVIATVAGIAIYKYLDESIPFYWRLLVADVIVEPVSKYPEKGVLEPVNTITMHNGGNAMTASINVRKLGVDSSMIGMVGDDMFGEYLRKILLSHGVNVSGLKVSDKVQTSASVLMIDKEGERSFFHCTGTNAVFSEKDIDYSCNDISLCGVSCPESDYHYCIYSGSGSVCVW